MAVSDLLSPPLSRLRARYAQTPLPRFFAWWWGELRPMLPVRWRKLLSAEAAQILLESSGDELQVHRAFGSEARELARLPLTEPDALGSALEAALGDEQAALPRVLLLPPNLVLRRILTLPTAALDNLRTVLGFELDRQTPFKPEQVVFDSRVMPYEPGAKVVQVELALVPRDRLQHALEALGPVAGTLGAVDVRGADGRRRGYNLLPAELRRSRSNTRLLMHLGLVAASLFFLALAMGLLLDNRAAAVAALGEESEAVQNEARAVARLRDSLEDAATAANFLAIEKSRQPSMVLLLDDLTRRLPDDTWLERLSFGRGEVSLSGQSGQAAKLLEILQESTLLRSPALSGPIQPDARSGKDRFNITAGYGPVLEDDAEDDDASAARR
jgi:general secretion pathway protein L